MSLYKNVIFEPKRPIECILGKILLSLTEEANEAKRDKCDFRIIVLLCPIGDKRNGQIKAKVSSG